MEYEKLHKSLFDHSFDGVCILDLDTLRFKAVNEAFCHIFGYEEGTLLNLTVFKLLPPRTPEGIDIQLFISDLVEGLRNGSKLQLTAPHLRSNGDLFEAELSLIPVDIEGSISALGVIRDISEKLRYEREQAAKVKELDEANQALQKYIDANMELENFAYLASHDLREPLRTITGFTQLLEKKYKDQFDEQGQTYMNLVIDAAKKMYNLIEDLRIYSEISSQKLKIESFSIRVLLQKLIQEMGFDLPNSSVQLTFLDVPDLVQADKSEISQLFHNLLDNAKKFRKADTVANIRLGGEGHPTHWRFWIEDQGIGIKSAYFEKIFLLSKQLHDKSTSVGTGMGLAICKKIVERHGGKLEVESSYGEKTCFSFNILKNL